jgi:hypothetical protein
MKTCKIKAKRNHNPRRNWEKTLPKIDEFLETTGEGVPTKPVPKARGA